MRRLYGGPRLRRAGKRLHVPKQNRRQDKRDQRGGGGGPRKQADAAAAAKERHRLFDESQAAFKSGDKAKAKQLSNEGKAAGERVDAANRKAARAVLEQAELDWMDFEEKKEALAG